MGADAFQRALDDLNRHRELLAKARHRIEVMSNKGIHFCVDHASTPDKALLVASGFGQQFEMDVTGLGEEEISTSKIALRHALLMALEAANPPKTRK